MSHEKYVIHAIIMNMFPDGDDSLVLECLTDELGRIYIQVQGVKKMHNKHRNMVTYLGMVTIDCVQGRRYFRCTGISEWENNYQDLVATDQRKKAVIKHTFGIIQRLVPSNIPISDVFESFIIFFKTLIKNDFPSEKTGIMTLIAQLRILGILGYWNSDWKNDVFAIDGKTFDYVEKNQRSVEKLIEKILKETQMNEFVLNEQKD